LTINDENLIPVHICKPDIPFSPRLIMV